MFTIIDFKNKNQNECGILKKLKYFSTKNKIYIEKFDEFYILHYNNYGRKIKWKKVIKKCPTEDVLLLNKIAVPKNFKVKTYNSGRYKLYLLKQTTERILRDINLPPSHKNLLFIDKNAEYCDFVSEIAKSCAGIYVLTNNDLKYAQLQRSLMKDLGLSLSICTKIPNKNNVILCIAFSDISCYNISLMDIPTFVIDESNLEKLQIPMSIILNKPKSFCYDNILPKYAHKIDVCGAVREINNKILDDYCEEFILRDNIINFEKLLLLFGRNT